MERLEPWLGLGLENPFAYPQYPGGVLDLVFVPFVLVSLVTVPTAPARHRPAPTPVIDHPDLCSPFRPSLRGCSLLHANLHRGGMHYSRFPASRESVTLGETAPSDSRRSPGGRHGLAGIVRRPPGGPQARA